MLMQQWEWNGVDETVGMKQNGSSRTEGSVRVSPPFDAGR